MTYQDGDPLPVIQGHQADSKEEVWIAESLWQFNIPFYFQYNVAGGLRVRRGMIVDFMLTHPKLHPFEFYGDYWHEAEMSGEDLIRMKALEQEFGVKPYIMWGNEAPDKLAVVQWVKKNIVK